MPGKLKLIVACYLLCAIVDAFWFDSHESRKIWFIRLFTEITIALLLCVGSDRMRASLRFFATIGVLGGGWLAREGILVGLHKPVGLAGFVYGNVLVVTCGFTVWALGSADVRTWFRRIRDGESHDD